MGITVEDFDLDGRIDLVLGHFFDDPNTIFLNQGGFFRDLSLRSRLGALTLRVTTFGISVLDLFNDGRMQLLFGNGKANMANKLILNEGNPYAERDLLLEWSYETQQFTDITDQAGPALQVAMCTRGTAVIDYDNDGDMDVVLTHNNEPARLLRVNAPKSNHWLMVRCIGPDGKRDADNAIVEMEVSGRKRMRQVYVAPSYCSSCDPRVHFGLGRSAAVDRLTVTWLNGEQSTWRNLRADQLFVARYGDTAAEKTTPASGASSQSQPVVANPPSNRALP